ncbi:uncharacterized protein [Nicotiana sylvestris]|uniref:uncharacterized protein n=1 Tax=Nicotiana sylvestris TaxID=4096 RepID=UPI00388CD481
MDIQALANRGVRIDHTLPGRLLAGFVAQSSLVGQVKARQFEDPLLVRLRDRAQNGGIKSFSTDNEGVLRRHGILCIPMVGDVKQLILEKAHSSRYSIHPGATKMCQDLRELYWWKGMKYDIRKHVTGCLNCQQVKYEHQKLCGVIQSLIIPEWKWERITMDFVVGLPRTFKRHDSVWVIVDILTNHKIQPEDVELDENLTYEEGLIAILDRQVRQLRSKKDASVKVLWRNHPTEEAT